MGLLPAGLRLETRRLHPRFRAVTAALCLFNYCSPQRAEAAPNPSVCPETANTVLGICQGSGSWVPKAEEVEGLPAGPGQVYVSSPGGGAGETPPTELLGQGDSLHSHSPLFLGVLNQSQTLVSTG